MAHTSNGSSPPLSPHPLIDRFQFKDCVFHLTKRSVITKSTVLDQYNIVPHFNPRWTREWKMKLPEIVFGENSLTITKQSSSHTLHVIPFLPYSRVDHTPTHPSKPVQGTRVRSIADQIGHCQDRSIHSRLFGRFSLGVSLLVIAFSPPHQ